MVGFRGGAFMNVKEKGIIKVTQTMKIIIPNFFYPENTTLTSICLFFIRILSCYIKLSSFDHKNNERQYNQNLPITYRVLFDVVEVEAKYLPPSSR